jgi:hypothetical protein
MIGDGCSFSVAEEFRPVWDKVDLQSLRSYIVTTGEFPPE